MLIEPLSNVAAKKLAVSILAGKGSVIVSDHALAELAKDGMTVEHAFAVVRAGYVEFSEEVRGSWRYRFVTPDACVVVAFRSETRLVVVSGWKRR